MTFAYDWDVDALDIRVSEGIVARTVEIDRGTLVDVDAQGRVLSIEIIRPGRPLPIDEILGAFAFDDADTAVLRSLQDDDRGPTFGEPAPLVLA